jgi:hypothetical protein
MPSLKDKKAALIAKIARQKAKQKEQVYTIPTISLSTNDKKTKVNKTFIPNTKTLVKSSKNEDKMREFLATVNGLTEDDFDITPGGYTNPDILNGYTEYMSTYQKEAVVAEDSPNFDLFDIRRQSENSWVELSFINKLKWVIKGYSTQKDSEWGRKQFAINIDQTIYTSENLHKFIDDYLERDVPYTKFINYWKSQRGEKEVRADTEEEISREKENEIDQQGIRLAVTEEEQARIDDMKERLVGYETAFEKLQEKTRVTEEFLSEKSHDELVELALPIIGKKTNEQLINTIIGAELFPIRREKYKELFGEKWRYYEEYGKILSLDEHMSQQDSDFTKEREEFDKFQIEFDAEVSQRKAELKELSSNDLIMEATSKKTVPRLTQLLIYEEFHKSRDSLRNKITNLSIEINNLSLGKYIPRKTNVRRLKYIERVYHEALVIHIRKLELETMSINRIRLHASVIGAAKNIGKIPGPELIRLILLKEFPNVNIDAKVPKVSSSQMKAVLLTLSDDQINVLAYTNGIQRPEYRGRLKNIETILGKEFPKKKIRPVIKLVEGKYTKNWSYHQRRQVLEGLSSKELKEQALILGIDIPKGTSDQHLINRILSWEENVAKLIPEEEVEKDVLIKKISSLTGSKESRYKLWTLEELKQRLEALRDENQEYWMELEQERLYNKLSRLVDIKSSKYRNANKWKLEKLRRKLEKIGGEDWENYKPLIEDYSFVKCMEKFSQYEWIEGKVTGVWLSRPDDGKPDKDYVISDIFIEEDGHKWYQASKKFFVLQCNQHKNKRSQDDDVLTSYTSLGQPVKFKVGFTIVGYQHAKNKYKSRTHMVTKTVPEIRYEDNKPVEVMVKKKFQRTFIIQDETLFNKEKQHDRKSLQSRSGAIQDILNDVISKRTINTVQHIISKELLNIAPMRTDYGVLNIQEIKESGFRTVDYNTPYMQILIQTLADSQEMTNEQLFRRAAGIVVYLKLPAAETFRKNIEKEYYLPDVLVTLTPAEKFPEAYQDPNLSGKFLDGLTTEITNKKYKFVRWMAELEYNLQDPTRRKQTTLQVIELTRSIKTQKRLKACENKDRVKGVPETEIIYYKEDGKIYCFSVDDLYERLILQEDIINPSTQNAFDLSFVKRFKELYNKRLSEDSLLSKYFQKKYGFDMDTLVQDKEERDTEKRDKPVIAIDLWNIVGKDIAELEDQLSNEKPDDGDEIDEKREEERREVETREGIRDSDEIDEADACVYCKTHLSDDSIKSIIFHNDESKIIKFCSFKCFEDKDDWNKFKIKRLKKKAKNEKNEKKAHAAIVEKVHEKMKPISPEPVKLSHEELKKRKELIKQQIKDGIAAFDKVALPLMTKDEIKEFANKKKIKIPSGLSKMGTASYVYKQLHPKSKTGIFKEKSAKKEMVKIETRRDKRKAKKTKKK